MSWPRKVAQAAKPRGAHTAGGWAVQEAAAREEEPERAVRRAGLGRAGGAGCAGQGPRLAERPHAAPRRTTAGSCARAGCRVSGGVCSLPVRSPEAYTSCVGAKSSPPTSHSLDRNTEPHAPVLGDHAAEGAIRVHTAAGRREARQRAAVSSRANAHGAAPQRENTRACVAVTRRARSQARRSELHTSFISLGSPPSEETPPIRNTAPWVINDTPPCLGPKGAGLTASSHLAAKDGRDRLASRGWPEQSARPGLPPSSDGRLLRHADTKLSHPWWRQTSDASPVAVLPPIKTASVSL